MSSKCVIFDMDATLIDSKKAIYYTINYIRKELNMTPLDAEFIIKTINDPLKNPIKEFYGIEQASGNMRHIFEEESDKNYMLYATVYEEAMKVVSSCKNLNYKLAVATNAPHATIERILKNCGILDSFDMIVGSNKEIPQKPDPTMLNLIRDSFKCECVFVGDSAKDYLASKNAKMDYIQVLWGRNEIIKGAVNCRNATEVMKILR